MYRIERFSHEHLVSLREDDRAVIGSLTKDYLRSYLQGPGWTLFHGDDRICSMGVITPWPGMGELWMAFYTDDLAPHARALLKYGRRALTVFASYRRLQATVRADRPKWIRFAQQFGFQYEGTLDKFGPEGADYFMMARIKWDQ